MLGSNEGPPYPAGVCVASKRKEKSMKILQRTEVILLISALFVVFFLPWGKVFFFTGSGYDT